MDNKAYLAIIAS